MSKLTKVVLINWMYFKKITLPIEGNTAIVGVNGTGKSTIIDAIQMLLLGQKQSKFNSGANAEKRTLESYVRGHVDSDNKEYLRQDDVITYLALEVDIDGCKHIFGINVEYKKNTNKLTDPRYFYIKNCKLDELLFVTEKNYPKPYDEFNKQIKKDYEFSNFSSLMSYQNKIKEIFGLKSDNAYFKILSRAIGLKNITECDKFMNEFVLDEETIDVSEIKNNILEMTKVSKTIEREEEKLHSLETIVVLGNKIESKYEELSRLELRNLLGTKMLYESQVTKLISDNKTYESLIVEENNKKTSLENTNDELNASRNEHIKLLDQVSPDLPQKQAELDNARMQYENAKSIFTEFKNKCHNELTNLSQLKSFKNKIFNSFVEYIKQTDYTTSSTKQKFTEFREEARLVEERYNSSATKMLSELSEFRSQLVELDNKIKALENNEHPFDSKYDEFKKYIKGGLYDKYKEDIEVKFLCEYLDITDESWRNAIEGYLGTQRFHLIVPNNYYKDALKLYHANKNLSSVRLINGTKLPDFDFEEGTLGSFIEASNDIALNYARLLLNRVHCVNDIFELDKFDISITKDCMCYQNYSSWRIPSSIYRKTFIGLEGLKKQLEVVKEEREKLSAEASKLYFEYNECIKCVNVIKKEEEFALSILENSSYITNIDLVEILLKKINKLTEEIKFYKSNPQYLDICDKIAKIEGEIKNNKNLISKSNELEIKYKSLIISNENEINTKNITIDDLIIQLSNFSVAEINDVTLEIDDMKLSNTYINKISQDIRALEKNIIEAKTKLESLMREARDKFSINCEPNYEALPNFREEKNKINNSVFKYNSKLVEMQKSHRKLFFSEFLSKLNRSIEQAKETIKNLNVSLTTFTFGNDYYQIKVDITDNQDLKTIYNYAKEFNSEDSARGLFVDREVEDRERKKVEELLNQYVFSEDVITQSIVVDYRKYLYFDVEVHTPDGKKSLNKVIRSQSGGEVQVPFYILSGVAFKQTLDYKRNKDSLGIVIYDEAFDKMDSQRIQSMLQFYKDKLKLQVILAAPGKLDSLVDNVETILAVVRDGEKAIVRDVSHEI